MLLPELAPKGTTYGMTGIIKIEVFSTIEEAQINLLDTPSGFSGEKKPDRLMDPPVGDVALGLEAYGYRWLFFSRANIFVSMMNIADSDTTRVLEELPAKIDAAILNAPAWKTGDPQPRLKISEEFIKAFPIPPR
jgi:hypothetical protein